MKIGEINKSGKFKELESMRKIAVLGHETFTKGVISFESADKVCDLLKLFKNTFKDYGVEHYEAMATSAIREADNRDYIVDQIKLKTGLDIKVITNSEEQFLTHKAIKNNLEDYETYIKEGAVIVVVGAGSIQITTYMDGELQSSQNVKMGALRLKEAFGEMEDTVLNYQDVMQEYIDSNLEDVDFFAQKGEYRHLIAVGGEINVIIRIIENQLGEPIESLTRKRFNKLFKKLKDMSVDEIVEAYGIKKERADIIIPSMMLFSKFLDNVLGNTIITPKVSLTDGIIRSIHEGLAKSRRSDENIHDIVTNARVIAKKFNIDDKHSRNVEELSLILFDRLKKLHGMKDERVLLHVAAILHEIGKIISLDKHYEHSYTIVRSLEIFGLSTEEMELIANISYYHSMKKPSNSHPNYAALPREVKTKAAKLIALMRLADALDRSHKGKIKIKSVRLMEKTLVIQGICKMNVDTTLEEWTFKRKAAFFIDVFGVTPILKIKRELI